jgi:hypothetical protein
MGLHGLLQEQFYFFKIIILGPEDDCSKFLGNFGLPPNYTVFTVTAVRISDSTTEEAVWLWQDDLYQATQNYFAG